MSTVAVRMLEKKRTIDNIDSGIVLEGTDIWMLFNCGSLKCPARLYVVGYPNDPTSFTIIRSSQVHMNGGTGCFEHKCAGPCIECVTRGFCQDIPCIVHSSTSLTPSTLASFHQMYLARKIQLTKSSESSSPVVIHAVCILFWQLDNFFCFNYITLLI